MTKKDIITRLKADTAIAALVGTRVYAPPAARGTATPLILVSRASKNTDQNLTAVSGWSRTTWQVDCYAETEAVADTLMDLILDNMNGIYDVAMGTSVVLSCILSGVDDMTEDKPDGGQLEDFRKMATFEVCER